MRQKILRRIQIRTSANDNKQWPYGPNYISVVMSQAIVRQRWTSRRNADPRGSDQIPNSRSPGCPFQALNGIHPLNHYRGCTESPARERHRLPPSWPQVHALPRWRFRTIGQCTIVSPIEAGCQRPSQPKRLHRRRWSWALACCSIIASFTIHFRSRTRESNLIVRWGMSGNHSL